MGSKFIERHKRKSIWALLLLLLRGRGKYIALLIMIILFSIPFVATSDMVERFFGLSPVRYVVKLFGLESAMGSISPKYSTDVLRAVFDRLKDEYTQFNPFMKGVGYEDRKGHGTLEYVRVGNALESSRKGKGMGNVGEEGIDEVSYDKDVSAGGVDFSDLLASESNGRLGGNKNNIWGWKESAEYRSDIFGISSSLGRFDSKELLASITGKGGNISGNIPGKGGKSQIMGGVGKGDIGADALALSRSNIPNVQNPILRRGGVRISRSGSITAFGWKNVGYTKSGADMSVNITGNRRALFQAGETMATTSMAYLQKPAYEYQAGYVGSTYDGSLTKGDLVVTSPDTSTSLPDTGYISTVVDSAQNWSQLAKECADAQKTHGTRISKLQNEIDDTIKTMTNPPKCCDHGAVRRWNNKVSMLVQKCNEINTESTALSQKCQNANPQIVDCQKSYGKLYIKPCSKWKCWLSIVLAIIGALIGFLIGGFVGAIIGAAIGFAIGYVGSMYLTLLAGMGAAFASAGAYFVSDKSKEAIKAVEDVNKDVREKD